MSEQPSKPIGRPSSEASSTMAEQDEIHDSKPAEVPVRVSPISGTPPPVEHQFKSGAEWTGNAKGRPAAGMSIIEWMNQLQDTTEPELEKIARDPAEKPTKRAAAIEWLDRLAGGHDIADFEGLCDGSETMAQLKGRGIPTRLLKKVKTTTRTSTRAGDEETEVRREVELNDRGGQAIDRILDRIPLASPVP